MAKKYTESISDEDKKLIWAIAWIFSFFILLVLAVLGTVALGLVISLDNRLDKHRYCFDMTNVGIYDDAGGGDPDGIGRGYLQVDLNSKVISYKFLFDGVGNITSFVINGPVNSTNVYTAPLFFPYDGEWDDPLEPNSNGFYQSSKSISSTDAQNIVKNPYLYYLILKSDTYPDGAIGQSITSDCTPNIDV
jgi:hypothetical protein